MKHLPLFKDFDPYVMIETKPETDVIALLNEIISELDFIGEILNKHLPT